MRLCDCLARWPQSMRSPYTCQLIEYQIICVYVREFPSLYIYGIEIIWVEGEGRWVNEWKQLNSIHFVEYSDNSIQLIYRHISSALHIGAYSTVQQQR
jgi:hypothetical protein